jgi:riboflavin synthase
LGLCFRAIAVVEADGAGESAAVRKTWRVFTGLVEEVGALLERRSAAGGGATLKVRAGKVLEGIKLGDSIAVNGVCLTATEWGSDWVAFDAVAETLRLTTLQGLSLGSPVNLERALAVGDRVGGHYVTGHIDGSGSLLSRETSGNGVVYRFGCPANLLAMVCSKGSIAVDGISLTVVDVTSGGFSVWIVPHTQTATNLGGLAIGGSVNLETDILAKYVNRALSGGREGISLQHLKEAGF